MLTFDQFDTILKTLLNNYEQEIVEKLFYSVYTGTRKLSEYLDHVIEHLDNNDHLVIFKFILGFNNLGDVDILEVAKALLKTDNIEAIKFLIDHKALNR